ncbi:MAG: hypothetical protein JST68_17475 [Bacteroidetes bacterium]|nr:hypothetical protein [Bacteroidota bacterium]
MKYILSFALFLLAVSASAQLTYETLYVDYDSAWTYKNLKIIPVRRKASAGVPIGPGFSAVPLNKALREGLVTISERGSTSFENVHFLRVTTKSDKPVYIAGGEIVAGGRQDRMVVNDTIIQPMSKDQYVSVMCVEEGRWADKEKKFGYGSFADPSLRRVLDSSHNQALVWREIDRQLLAGNIKNNTLAYMSRFTDKKYVGASDEYMKYFTGRLAATDSTVVGIVAISGDRIIGTDIFDGKELFYGQAEPLLRGYVDEAVQVGTPVTMKDGPVHKYMDGLLGSEPAQEAFVKDRGKVFRQGGHAVHVNTYR